MVDPIFGSLGAAGISALANIGGGMMSASGAEKANQANIDFQRQQNQMDAAFQNRTNEDNRLFAWDMNDKNMDNAREMFNRQASYGSDQSAKAMSFSADQAQRMMDFQERMSSTAYQRATKDMRAAGINPLLAYQQGGALGAAGAMGSSSMGSASGSAPTGSSAPGSVSRGTAPHVGNTQEELGRAVGRIASSAADTYKTIESARIYEPQQMLFQQQGKQAGQSAEKIIQETYTEKERSKNEADRNDVIKAEADLVRSQAGAARARAAVDAETARQYTKHGLPGYGLGERLIGGVGALGDTKIPVPEGWPKSN